MSGLDIRDLRPQLMESEVSTSGIQTSHVPRTWILNVTAQLCSQSITMLKGIGEYDGRPMKCERMDRGLA